MFDKSSGWYMETARSPHSLGAIEFHDLLRGHEEKALSVLRPMPSLTEDTKKILQSDAKVWLPAAAEAYNISPDIRDYIMVPVIAMPTELPNRNQVSFSFLELTRYQPMARNIAYKLWKGSGCFKEHSNDDFLKAKGINFDSIMKPMRHVKGNLHKVITLSGFDRRKDPALANAILTGERTGYSMGCLVRDYISSCCAAKLSEGGCEHMTYGKPKFVLVNGRLAHWQATDLLPYEISSVVDPAYISAINPDYIKMFDD